MKEKKKPLIFVLAIIGVCAIVYGIWHVYKRQISREEHQQSFSAPEPSGLPNFLSATPGAPPPQP